MNGQDIGILHSIPFPTIALHESHFEDIELVNRLGLCHCTFVCVVGAFDTFSQNASAHISNVRFSSTEMKTIQQNGPKERMCAGCSDVAI